VSCCTAGIILGFVRYRTYWGRDDLLSRVPSSLRLVIANRAGLAGVLEIDRSDSGSPAEGSIGLVCQLNLYSEAFAILEIAPALAPSLITANQRLFLR
jgi:hypothetical protein